MIAGTRFFRLLWFLLPLLWLANAPLMAAELTPQTAFRAAFTQTRSLPDMDAPLVSRGSVELAPDGSFSWRVEEPYHYTFAMHEGRAWEILPDGTRRELDRSKTPWLEAVEQVFVGALRGDRQRLENYFDVSVAPAHKSGEKTVTLIPKDKTIAQSLERIRVRESDTGQPRHIDLHEADGGRMQIRFTPLAAESSTAP